MADLKIDGATKAMELLNQYPWLKEELMKVNDAFKALDNPVVKGLLKNASLSDVAGKLNMNEQDIIKGITKLISEHVK